MRSVRPLAPTSPSDSRDCRNSIAARGSACAECFAVRYPWFVSGSAARPCGWTPPNQLGGRTSVLARHVCKEALRWTSTLHPLQLQQRVLSRQLRPCLIWPAELRTLSMVGRDTHTEVAGKFSEPSDIEPSFVRSATPASGRVRRAAGFPRAPCEVSSSPRGARCSELRRHRSIALVWLAPVQGKVEWAHHLLPTQGILRRLTTSTLAPLPPARPGGNGRLRQVEAQQGAWHQPQLSQPSQVAR
ncbi:hypothetical protein, conserved [Leishmania lindenbergi]|uniref:Uncharacterized protein n=1 Tax=Leishmania lindenbergi TaxID=651832 RepID=A0AAW3A380_9TRYP